MEISLTKHTLLTFSFGVFLLLQTLGIQAHLQVALCCYTSCFHLAAFAYLRSQIISVGEEATQNYKHK